MLTPSISKPGVRLTTMFSRPGSGFPSDAKMDSKMKSDPGTGLLDAPPTARQRPAINAFILCVLIYHVVVPLRFYCGASGLDERFSWRFFSSVSLMKHNFHIDEVVSNSPPAAKRALPLHDLLQIAAIKKLLNTHHDDIVNAFLNWRASQPGVQEVHYYRHTTTTDGRQLPLVHYQTKTQVLK